jgi:hypothetical protein
VSSDKDRRGETDRSSDRPGESSADGRSAANRRSEDRTRKRIPCEISSEGQSQRGFVLDVSPKGLFVQTSMPIDPGEEIGVALDTRGVAGTIEIRAKVARSRRVPPRLVSVSTPGVGLRITQAPSEWYEFVAGLTSSELRMSPGLSAQPGPLEVPANPERDAALDKPAAPKKRKRKLPPRMAPPNLERRYRVQAKHIGGPRCRSLVVSATSRENAEWVAFEELGSDWKVIDVEDA